MSEYIGSRISLISKSDIKYIGTLHEINSDTHTVALESVTSYGTEGRKGNPTEEIPGSDQVYEYIVFRGSDVKELTIVAPPGTKENQAPPKVPDDPAILGSARPVPQNQQQPQQPPNQNQNQNQFRGPPPPHHQQHPQFGYPGPPPNQFQNQPRFQGPGGPHGFPGSPGAVPGYGFGPPGGPPPGYYGPPPGQGFPQQPPPGNFNQNQQMPPGPPNQQMNQQRPPQQMQGQQQQPPVGSKQGTPQPQASQAPPPPSQPAQQPKPVEMSATPGPTSDSSTGPPPPVSSKPPVSAAMAPSAAAQAQQANVKPVQKTNSRVAVPQMPAGNTFAAKAAQKPAPPPQTAPAPGPAGQPQSVEDATQAATAAVAAAMAKLGPVNQAQGKPPTDSTDNLMQKVNQMRLQDQQRGGSRGGRGRGSAFRGSGGRRESAQKNIDVPKEDYDFESANAKFNKQDLVKEAIASGSPIASPTNGEKADPMAAAAAAAANGEVNGESAAAADDDVVIPAAPRSSSAAAEKGYDKKSSFFDNISSDLKDRTEQAQAQQDGGAIDGRTMRREERTKNVETFGQGSVDQGGYRGGYRGRGRVGRGYGGYRGGPGTPGRGGYPPPRGGYRGRGAGGGGEAAFV